MWIRQILVAVVGLASGFAVAAGLFSFIIGLGVVSDFADRTHTGKHVMLYENCIMAGGILGNIFWVYGLAMPGGKWIVPVFGLFSGIFVGCWSMALAEILNMSDRVVVMCDGTIKGILDKDEATQEKIMQYAVKI